MNLGTTPGHDWPPERKIPTVHFARFALLTYRQEFLKYIRTVDCSCVGPFYSAYPERTVLDVLGLASAPNSPGWW